MLADQSSTIRSTQASGFGAFSQASSESHQQGAFRAVEYIRSQDGGERVRVTNIEELNSDIDEDISAQALKIDRINTDEFLKQAKSYISTHKMQESKKTVTLSEDFSVKLFPATVNDNETQEMTMFIANSMDDLNLERAFKIDLNNNNKK